MRTLAVDLGARRVGLALSDAGGTLATPHAVLIVASPLDAQRQVGQVVEREGVERVVVGVPLNMDGTAGSGARSAAAWGRQLCEATRVPVILVDERLSSFAAEQSLISRKRTGERITRRAKKQRLDAHAAATFLQEFLNGKLSAISPNEFHGRS